jgi:hypothetical protein
MLEEREYRSFDFWSAYKVYLYSKLPWVKRYCISMETVPYNYELMAKEYVVTWRG